MKFEYFPPVGTGNVEEWKALGWNEDDAIEYLKGYYAVVAAPLQQEYLRIPGAAEYWHELDVNVSAVLGGQMQAEGGARRHRGGVGEGHRPLRARQAEGVVPGVVHLNEPQGKGSAAARCGPLVVIASRRRSNPGVVGPRRSTGLLPPGAPTPGSLACGQNRRNEGAMATATRVQRLESGGAFKYALLLPAVVWVVVFTFFPLISVIRYSFANYVLGEGITGYVGFANYVEVLTSDRFWHAHPRHRDLCRGGRPHSIGARLSRGVAGQSPRSGNADVPHDHRLAAVHPRSGDRLSRRDLLHRPGRADRRAAGRARHSHSLDVDRLRRDRRRHPARRLAVDLVHLHHRARGPVRHSERPLRRGGARREKPLAGDVASGDPARLAGDHDRRASAHGRVPEGLRHPLRADLRRTGHQHRALQRHGLSGDDPVLRLRQGLGHGHRVPDHGLGRDHAVLQADAQEFWRKDREPRDDQHPLDARRNRVPHPRLRAADRSLGFHPRAVPLGRGQFGQDAHRDLRAQRLHPVPAVRADARLLEGGAGRPADHQRVHQQLRRQRRDHGAFADPRRPGRLRPGALRVSRQVERHRARGSCRSACCRRRSCWCRSTFCSSICA